MIQSLINSDTFQLLSGLVKKRSTRGRQGDPGSLDGGAPGCVREKALFIRPPGQFQLPEPPANRAPTGVWFAPQTGRALAAAIAHFEEREAEFQSDRIRAWAERFSGARFREQWQTQVDAVLQQQC